MTLNGQVGIVAVEGTEIPGDAEDHVGVFFGNFDRGQPEIWTIPTEYLSSGPTIVLKH